MTDKNNQFFRRFLFTKRWRIRLSIAASSVLLSAGIVWGYAFLLAQKEPEGRLQRHAAARLEMRLRASATPKKDVSMGSWLFPSLKSLGPTLLAGSTIRPLSSLSGPSYSASGGRTAIPSFGKAVFPVDQVPNWGKMHAAAEWDRPFGQMEEPDFVPVPSYDLKKLTFPMKSLLGDLNRENTSIVTAKLFYSTRYFGKYDLDAGEFSGLHDGVDLKLALGTPIRAIGGGRVTLVENEGAFGLHIIIEHQLPNGEKYYSIYGHLQSASVQEGGAVAAGQMIGTVGQTGNSTAPHLHLQIDRDDGTGAAHVPYVPVFTMSPEEAGKKSVNPIAFIQEHQ